MVRVFRAILWSAVLLIWLGIRAQCQNNYIITARRAGLIEFIDPATLKTISSIRVNVARDGTGLNGVFADSDGHTIYVEGPIRGSADTADGCCWLYSVDLTASQTKMVAGIWGTRSRYPFISAGPSLLERVSWPTANLIEKARGDNWQASPDGRWRMGLRDGPALDLYEVAGGKIVQSFAVEDGEEPSLATGTWLGSQFHVYTTSHGSGRLWTLTAQSKELGEGVPVRQLDSVPGCSSTALTNITGAGNRLFLHEVFGSKIDRRDGCGEVAGGAWVVDPATGQLSMQVAASLHFWMVVPNQAGTELYGITSEMPLTQAPAQLVRVDTQSGKVLQSRSLDSDYWWIATASLRSIPSGDVSVTLPTVAAH